MGTSVQRASASPDLHKRGEPFGLRTMTVDGMSVTAVYEAGRDATEYVRSGEGPVLMEVNTYRYRGHSMSDPAKYRAKEELQKMREQFDPIDRLRAELVGMKAMDEDGFKAIDKEIKDIVTAAAEFSQTSPEPDPAELWTDILVEAA
jgi:pyruvate dehydrogenase E1 component alpha subunit